MKDIYNLYYLECNLKINIKNNKSQTYDCCRVLTRDNKHTQRLLKDYNQFFFLKNNFIRTMIIKHKCWQNIYNSNNSYEGFPLKILKAKKTHSKDLN